MKTTNDVEKITYLEGLVVDCVNVIHALIKHTIKGNEEAKKACDNAAILLNRIEIDLGIREEKKPDGSGKRVGIVVFIIIVIVAIIAIVNYFGAN